MKICYLILATEAMQKTVYPLFGLTTIGRGTDNTITLPDAAVSRNHAKVILQEGVWTVEDLGSANGIIHGDKRVERLTLKCGDSFQIGRITFRFAEKEVGQGDQFSKTVELLSDPSKDELVSAEKGGADPLMKQVQDSITAIPFFSSLDETERKRLADAATLHVFNPGEMILREGKPDRSIYVIVDGRIRVFRRDSRGEELELSVLEVGQFFGAMSLVTGKPRSSSVAALDTSILIELSHTSIGKLTQKHSAVKKALLQYCGDSLETSERKRAGMGMEKRRHDPRLKEQLPVSLVMLSQTTPKDKKSPSSWQAKSVDISISGVVVAVPGTVPAAFRPEDEVSLEIGLPPPWGQVRTMGTIRRVKPVGAEKNMTLIGIKFAGVADTDGNKLQEFLCAASSPKL